MDRYKIEIPEFCLVVMIGGSSSGKTTFAHRHFKETEVLSSDAFRAMISDDENDQSISAEAFELLYHAADKRLSNMKLTVIDATNVKPMARKQALDLAKRQNVHAVAIVMNLPLETLLKRNGERKDRGYPERIIRSHYNDLKKSIKYLKKEGFRFIYEIDSEEQASKLEIVRTKLWNDKKEEHGPFDIIGDVHGCYDELEALLDKLGYIRNEDGRYFHPEGRKAVFLGDFCDRGPRNIDTLKLIMGMTAQGDAFAVPGNHDVKLLKYLKGSNVNISYGLETTVEEFKSVDEAFKDEAAKFIDGLISHYVLDDGKLVVAHAGLKQEFIGRGSGAVRSFCLYGDTTGENDELGLPVRLDWAADYRGRALIVYGHVPSKDVREQNGTYCIDTGCVFGGKLTAFRYPEKEILQVPAFKTYYDPPKPLDGKKKEEEFKDMLSIGDVQGKMYLETRLTPSISINENNVSAALETMSRYAADPHWLIYLPPTMSPCETSKLDGYLEHPLQAFEYFHKNGVRNVICEKKHMGSRSVIVLCKDENVVRDRFGICGEGRGIIYTRTGRRFFWDLETERTLLDRLDTVLTKTNFWDDFNTDWVCLDTELMPWSEKAQELLRTQYAPVGRSGEDGLTAAIGVLKKAASREIDTKEVSPVTSGQNLDISELLGKFEAKKDAIDKYIKAYGEYCWTVRDVDDFKIAPFHILACEGKVFSEEKHVWHMETIRKYMTGIDSIFVETPYLCVDTEDEESIKNGTEWWLNLTGSGGEGMVVKPETFIARYNGNLIQPAVKCRGREYLRIIYGPEYLNPDYLTRLKNRSLGRKRNLALKEFSLGMESLERFVRKEPLYRMHECVFGVLALESEPVDPRL